MQWVRTQARLQPCLSRGPRNQHTPLLMVHHEEAPVDEGGAGVVAKAEAV